MLRVLTWTSEVPSRGPTPGLGVYLAGSGPITAQSPPEQTHVRSDKAGKLLAEVLLKGLQGNRPVTLVGYSLRARVIFKCLQFLSKSEHKANIVERVVLLGAPISIKDESWESARKIVAGRFVNVFSRNDWMLGVAFRASLLTKGLAGIQAVDVPGIENVDATDIIEGHSSYLWATQQILDQLDLGTYFPVFRSSPTQN